jgi:hypothetical protein
MLIEYKGMLIDADSIKLRAEKYSHSYYENEYNEGELILEVDVKGHTKEFSSLDELYCDVGNDECQYHPPSVMEDREDDAAFVDELNELRCPCFTQAWGCDGRLDWATSDNVGEDIEYGRIPQVLQTYIELKDLVIAKLKEGVPKND